MKKIYYLVLFIIIFTIISGFEHGIYRVHYSTGPDPGYSGDPASGYHTCADCHADYPVRQMNSVITSNIPQTGYIPNNTYTIYLNVSETNIKRYGFQVSAQNENGDFLGYFNITDDNRTQWNTANNNYVNHSSNGIDFPDGKAQWSFNWVAPNEGSGEVTFYGAFVLSNESYSPSGDIVATSTLSLQEASVTSVKNSLPDNNSFSLNIFPNPTSEKLQFSVIINNPGTLLVNIVQSDGKVIYTTTYSDLAAKEHKFSLPINHLKQGLYHLQLHAKGEKTEKRFWVK